RIGIAEQRPVSKSESGIEARVVAERVAITRVSVPVITIAITRTVVAATESGTSIHARWTPIARASTKSAESAAAVAAARSDRPHGTATRDAATERAPTSTPRTST